jgi:glycerophosphoryl diester phosphodiesterase
VKYAFAHRGGRGHGSDNTIPTFAEALARGATGLETDAWVTADGVVVLDHDGLHRTERLDQLSITQVERAELAEHIPTLDDLYAACGIDFDLAIDVKGATAPAVVAAVAAEHGAAERLWLFTQRSRRGDSVGRAHVGVTVNGKDLRNGGTRHALLQQLKDDGAEVVNARWPSWRRHAVDDVHEMGMLVFAWDVQWPAAARWCRRLDIDGIFSDHVRVLVAAQR